MVALIESTPFTLTAEQLQPIVDAVTSNVPVIMTAGLGIMAVTIVIGLVPKFIRRFVK